MKTYIRGIFKKIIFKSDRGYIIGLFRVKETNDENLKDYENKTITFTGYFHELTLEEKYVFYGEIVNHPKYGFQFNVTEYEREKPTGKEGLVEFLSSDLFPGVGEKLAISIVDTLGLDALDKINKDKSVLNLVPKLSTKKIDLIYTNLLKYNESSNTIIYLSELGFSMKDALSIYNVFKNNTKNIIENNIYIIGDFIEDISFLKLDEIALKQGIKEDDKNRVKSTIIYVSKNTIFSNGDTYLEYIDILKNVELYLKTELNSEYFSECLEELLDEGKLIKVDECYYLTDVYTSEKYVAYKLLGLSSLENKKYKDIELSIKKFEHAYGIIYNDKQKEAIIKSLESNVLIITGGPGTGKTTIIKAIVELYKTINKLSNERLLEDVALLAPTGRASKRMSEQSGLPASTIHRFLKWNKETDEFAVNEDNPASSKFIIVDEVSMIDISLLSSLLRGLNNNIHLVLVGDYNQLPSVGPGEVLKDLIDSDVINTVHLDALYRQDENSYINILAQEIKDNTLSDSFLEQKSDYTFLKCSSSSIKENLKVLSNKLLEKGYDYKKVQIMAPMYHGENGIDNLNITLQEIFNPFDISKNELTYGDVTYRENDKVLQLVNMPDEKIFNGDIGIIKKIIPAAKSESKQNEIYIDFDDNLVRFEQKDFNKFKHGYIISIHKSQGSEFDTVIIPICSSYKRMLYRKLIYTAVTRAKRKLIILGEAESFIFAVQNNNEYKRKTSLLNRINEILYSETKK